MDPKLIEKMIKEVIEASKETKTLYELSESDMIVFTVLLMELPINSMSASLLGRFLRAAAHFIERNEEIAKRFADAAAKDKE